MRQGGLVRSWEERVSRTGRHENLVHGLCLSGSRVLPFLFDPCESSNGMGNARHADTPVPPRQTIG